ncbi:MAG: polyribonucleotide nucleotidyltransferase, partial [Bacilli bacterium]|nr:polyribonucleotide nucleotidyltransferase [Bacilli bacterium]
INPTPEQLEVSELDLTVAGTKEAINMVESSAKQVPEDVMLEALMVGHEAVKELIAFQEEIIKEIGEEKMEYETLTPEPELVERITSLISDRMDQALRIKDKLEKYAAIDAIKEEIVELYTKENEDTLKEQELKELLVKVNMVVSDIEYELFRSIVVKEGIRADGRQMDEIRPLSTDIDLLPRVHGSALFTRGQTQALSTTTLGALNEHQVIDGLGLEDQKRFMLHYNFPQFSVGETGRYGAPGRREIGHGALGEKALAQVIPSEEEFPYTIRVVSEILESNGSSSQASICAGCMSLMAAGVPIKAPVAGIAMGLITHGEDYTILTDIQGMEDHLGDMDFKVAGTKDGITALQMDIKIAGINRQILKEALAQAKKARLQILDVITAQIAEPRKEVSKYAPKMETFMISPGKIKDVIGKGGEMITKIICEASNVTEVTNVNAVKVELEDDGRVIIYHSDRDIINKTREMIENITREAEEGKIYDAKVVKVEDFGCFVQIWPGCEGLVHVSQLSDERVEKPSDVVSVGDEIVVKCLGLDKKGRLNFSRKEALPKKKKVEKKEETPVEETVEE